MYNEDYINDFTEQQYLSFLGDPVKLDELKTAFIGRYKENTDIIDLAFKDSLDHFVVKKLKEDSHFIDSEYFKNYIKYLKDIHRERKCTDDNGNVYHPEIYCSILFRCNKDLVSKIFNRFFTKEEILEINKDCKEYRIFLMNCLTKMQSKFVLSQRELNIIGDYLYTSKRCTTDLAKGFLRYVLAISEKSSVKSSFPIACGILTMCPYEFTIFGSKPISNSRIYVGKTDGKRDFNIAHSRFDKNICAFKRDYIEKIQLGTSKSIKKARGFKETDIYHMLFIAFHELTHQYQKLSCDKKLKNSSALAYTIKIILSAYMPKKQVNGKTICDYSTNHDSDEIEIEADEFGQSALRHLVSEYKDNNFWSQLFSNVDEVRSRRAISYKQDVNGNNRKLYYLYDIENLERIIKEHPEELNRYPTLLDFFTPDGKMDVRKILARNAYTTHGAEHYYGHEFNNTAMEFVLYCFTTKRDEIMNLVTNSILTYDEVVRIRRNIYLVGKNARMKIDLILDTNFGNLDETKTHLKINNPENINYAYNYYLRLMLDALVTYQKIDAASKGMFSGKLPEGDLNELLVKTVNGINSLRKRNISFEKETVSAILNSIYMFRKYTDVEEIYTYFLHYGQNRQPK